MCEYVIPNLEADIAISIGGGGAKFCESCSVLIILALFVGDSRGVHRGV